MKQWLKKAITTSWVKGYILIGYEAKGILYLLIAIFVVQAAIFSRYQAPGTYSTLNIVTNQPFGKLLVCLLAIGLIGLFIILITQITSNNNNPRRFQVFKLES